MVCQKQRVLWQTADWYEEDRLGRRVEGSCCAEGYQGRRCQEALAGVAGVPTLQEEPSRMRERWLQGALSMHGMLSIPDSSKMAQDHTARCNLKEWLWLKWGKAKPANRAKDVTERGISLWLKNIDWAGHFLRWGGLSVFTSSPAKCKTNCTCLPPLWWRANETVTWRARPRAFSRPHRLYTT